MKQKLQALRRLADDSAIRAGAGLAAITVPGVSLAAPPDMTALTDAVDFSTVTAAVLSVAASLIVVYIAWKGAKMVMNALKGG